MFEGNKSCTLCKTELGENEKNFGVSLLGCTYIYCDKCFKTKKDDIKKMLHDDNGLGHNRLLS
ncbi:hypothetical protein H0O00_03135 [Candidatus Micrarchaeota archaeon]|nr:hypothetical protein [Candidatus Micrarchaeota archaeon]